MVIPEGTEYGSMIGFPINLIFEISMLRNSNTEYLELLLRLSIMLMNPGFKCHLINEKNVDEFLNIIDARERKSSRRKRSRRKIRDSVRTDPISILSGAQLRVPHGGIFFFPIVTNPLGYQIVFVIGSIVTMVLLVIFKKPLKEKMHI